ncbi:MAG: hypothetical protein LAO51_17280, partial [Acidobacteriia bacterium]|nr:hypothetical protein [Terriglobia bacterium]
NVTAGARPVAPARSSEPGQDVTIHAPASSPGSIVRTLPEAPPSLPLANAADRRYKSGRWTDVH